MKDSQYIKINNVNLLYLIFNKVHGYFEEINKNGGYIICPHFS